MHYPVSEDVFSRRFLDSSLMIQEFSWWGSKTIWGVGLEAFFWMTLCLLVHQRSSDWEPRKFRPRRVNNNKRKDNHFLLGIRRQPQRRADLLILHSGRTADHQLPYFKRPWLSSLAPPSRFLQWEHHNTSPHFLLHFWSQSVVWLIRC